jgi:nitrile hydratase subunit beta
MDGIHDLGGMHGFGSVPQTPGDTESYAPWERSVQGLFRVALARRLLNLDEFRHGIERMAPADYLRLSYYERWYSSIERNLVEKGLVTEAEVAAQMARLDQQPSAPPPSQVGLAGGPSPRPTSSPFRRDGPAPIFSVGDRVVTRNLHPKGHTRLPRYARGKHGVIQRVHGVFVFPDTNAHGLGEQPQAVYSVRFDAHELWGDDSEPAASVSLDLWESYLEPDRERPPGDAERS